MKERIDIIIDKKRLEANEEKRARLEAVHRGEKADRTPVSADVSQYFLLDARGSDFRTAMTSPRDNLREQVLDRKWRLENIDDDNPIPVDAWVFGPSIGCLRGIEFEMEISWEGNAPKCTHPLTEPEQIDDLEVPDPAGGLNAMYIEWVEGMQAAANELELRLNGQPIELVISRSHGGGPIPASFALAGENMLMWMLTDPERMHRLMDIATQSHINCVRFWDQYFGREPSRQVWLGCDTAEMLSPELFREFVVPFYERIWQEFPARRVLHMCGQVDHLLEILRDEMEIDFLTGFGFPTDRNKLAEIMAGKVILSGGPSPMLVKSGPIVQIQAESRDYIKTVGKAGGYILQSGGGIPVGTPVEHINALVEAGRGVEQYSINSL